MAGTRLAAHTCFLLFSLISVLVAWRLGVVKRAPLPLKNMADPYTRYPPQMPVAAASSEAAGSAGGPRPPAVDIDVVLLRSPSDKDCPSCAAALEAMQANPSLARNTFLAAAEEATAAATAEHVATSARKENGHLEHDDGTARGSPNETMTAPPPLFAVREVNLRVVHADHGVAAGNAAPPLLASSNGGGPTALDDWLHRHFIDPPSQKHADAAAAGGPGAASASTSSAHHPSSPRYTFFIACAGAGDAGELPTFTMGKHRHGYLGLGCPCSSCAASADTAITTAGKAGGGGGGGTETTSPAGPPPDGKLAAAAALAVLQALAGLVLAHVLKSPVRASDVHVRRGQAYRLNFSLLSEDPGLRRCAWDFARASRRYLRPLLRKLRPVASFAVQSQEVQYARLAPAPPRWFPGKRRWFYTPGDLQGFLGANDFSTLDLAAGWGPGNAAAGGGGGNATLPSSAASASASASSPHSQVPVNFMMFCPSPETSPLVFMEEWIGAGGRDRPFTEAYEVPGFGGVSVVNRGGDVAAAAAGGDDDALDVLEPDRLRRAFGSHVSQLRRIIGLPRPSDRPSEVPWPWLPDPGVTGPGSSGGGRGGGGSGSGSGSGTLCGGSSCPATPGDVPPSRSEHRALPLTFLPSPADGMTDWEVDALLRAGMARNRATAAETLRSLAALVESQPEMEVSSKIAEDVNAAIAALVKSDALVSEATAAPVGAGAGGAGVGEWAGAGAMCWAREALRRSEAAYFDPTMVPQLYFPQDHLMAVYFPFLAPLAFPLIFGFAQELWRYYRKRKAKQQRRRRDAGGSGTGVGGGGSSSSSSSRQSGAAVR